MQQQRQQQAQNNTHQSLHKKIARQFLMICSGLSDELVAYIINEKKQYYLQKNPKNIRQCLIRIYVFCYVWSFGGGLKREDNFEDDNLINQKEQVKVDRDLTTQDFDTFVR